MTTLEVGKKLVELCKARKNHEAMVTLYAHVEAGGPPGQDRHAHGLKAIAAKSQWWADNHTVHSATVEGPWPHDDRFVVKFVYDVTKSRRTSASRWKRARCSPCKTSSSTACELASASRAARVR